MTSRAVKHQTFIERVIQRLSDPHVIEEIDARLDMLQSRMNELTALRRTAWHAQRYREATANGEFAKSEK